MSQNTDRLRLVTINAVDRPTTVLTCGGAVARGRELPAGPPDSPLVLAHRGMPGPRRAENSVSAVEAALTHGADGAEIDVRLTADGVFVCSHGPTVRIAEGRRMALSSHTSAEVRRATLHRGCGLATLPEVLLAVRRHGPHRLVVEAKPVPDRAAAVRAADAMQRAMGVAGGLDLVVSSFDASLLGLIRDALSGSGVRTALLGDVGVPAGSILRGAVDAGHDEVHLNVAELRRAPHVIKLARRLEVAVTAWTVNRPEDLNRLADLGVEAVITDDVVTSRAGLSGRGSVDHGAGVDGDCVGATAS